jgi:hypothetical protein
MKLRTVVALALIGAALVAAANLKDIERYLRLRSM